MTADSCDDFAYEPIIIAEGLASMSDTVPGTPVIGTRMPGCFDLFETACRAVLGQQWRPWRSYAVVNLWNSLTGE